MKLEEFAQLAKESRWKTSCATREVQVPQEFSVANMVNKYRMRLLG